MKVCNWFVTISDVLASKVRCQKRNVRWRRHASSTAFFILLLLFLTSGKSGLAAGLGELTFTHDQLILESVAFHEISQSQASQSIDLGMLQIAGWTGNARKSSDAVSPNFANMKGDITRTVPAFWQIRLPADINPYSLDINYEVVACNNERDSISNSDDSDSQINVTVEDTTLQITREKTTILVEGGVILRLSLKKVRTAGSYCGTLIVTIDGI
jgi:hypothetical protein